MNDQQYLRTLVELEKSEMMRTLIQQISTQCKKLFNSSVSYASAIRSLKIKYTKKKVTLAHDFLGVTIRPPSSPL